MRRRRYAIAPAPYVSEISSDYMKIFTKQLHEMSSHEMLIQSSIWLIVPASCGEVGVMSAAAISIHRQRHVSPHISAPILAADIAPILHGSRRDISIISSRFNIFPALTRSEIGFHAALTHQARKTSSHQAGDNIREASGLKPYSRQPSIEMMALIYLSLELARHQ